MTNTTNELSNQITEGQKTNGNGVNNQGNSPSAPSPDNIPVQPKQGSSEPVTQAPNPEETLLKERENLAYSLNGGRAIQMRTLGWGIPLLIVTLIIFFSLPSIFLEPFSYVFPSLIILRLVVWSLTLVIFGSFYLFRYILPIASIKKELARIDEQIKLIRLSTFDGKKDAYEGELRKLTNLSAKAFFENQERAQQAAKLRKEARGRLGSKTPDLGEVQYCIDSLNELIARERLEQQNQSNWRAFAIVIMLAYIIGLVASAFALIQYGIDINFAFFGIPVSVVLWGGTGSLAAILYRFYQEKGLVKFDVEVRWLIARPIIGIIMGAVVYLSLVSGLILLGASPSTAAQATDSTVPGGRLEVYWIIAFLAGFSDKFYIGIINLLVAKSGVPDINTESERNPATIAEAQSKSASP